MNKKGFILIIILIFMLTLNSVMASDVDNTTDTIAESSNDPAPILTSSLPEDTVNAASSNLKDTKLVGENNITFDSIGEYYQIKLVDDNNKAISNAPVKFDIVGKEYNGKTDSKGIASLQINLNDGVYNITTKYAGSNIYKTATKFATITVNNTRYVQAGLTNAEIQKIIDDAKPNNRIVFLGSSYNYVNLEITKSLTLISNVNTLLKSSLSKPVISIKGKGASLTTIKGFKIDSAGNGIVVENSDYVEIYNNEIQSKGYGILTESTNYLNITKNKITQNSKDGIVLALAKNAYIIGNDISKNTGNGVAIAASENVYMYSNTINENEKNGILMDSEANFVEYGSGPKNIYIDSNTISKNKGDGIEIRRAENNVNILSNTINNNAGNGISIHKIGNNNIRSNVINSNGESGIRFKESYIKPKEQFIGHNVIINNAFREIDARETYYDEGKFRLGLEDNWYGDNPNICPKIQTANLELNIKQYSSYFFNISFTDSAGNIVTDMPTRIAAVKVNNGRTKYVTITGGTATFEIDASDGSTVKVTVDDATRTATYKFSDPSYIDIYVPPYDDRVRPIDEVGQPYPGIPRPGLYQNIPANPDNEDRNNGENQNNNGENQNNIHSNNDVDYNRNSNSGTGTGGGNGNLGSTGGNGTSSQNSAFTGNSTTTQNSNPSSSLSNPISSAQASLTASASAGASAESASAESSSASESVVKKLNVEEEDIVKVSGTFLIVLLILLTIAYYYKDDIKEMKAKM